jgi:putative FmdB family regulatory protein
VLAALPEVSAQMPTYEYACKSCGEHVEVVQSFRDEPLSICVACGGPLRRVFTPIGIAFKGSGFYRTDSRASANGSKPRARSEGGKADGGGGESAKGEASKDSTATSAREGTSASGSSTSGASAAAS